MSQALLEDKEGTLSLLRGDTIGRIELLKMAMNYWAINKSYTMDKEEVSTTSSRTKVRITSTIKEKGLHFQKNDQCLLMNDLNSEIKEAGQLFVFQQQGKIIGFDDPVLKPQTTLEKLENEQKRLTGNPVKEEFIHGIDIEITDDSQQPILLDDIAFSLASVYRFIQPEKHFQQQVRRLPKEDFKTIADRLVYVARTAFGKIANALPRDNKLEFVLLAIDKFGTLDYKRIKFSDALAFLLLYIRENIISQGMFLVETDNMLRNNFGDNLPVDEIALIEQDIITEDADVHESKPNLVSLKLFRELIKADNQAQFLDVINAGITQNGKIEERFHKLFSNKAWPIDLSV
jgi:hypothetical protein